MKNEFGGVGLALGTVRGFRSWKIDTNATLLPLHQQSDGAWLPGENVSACNKYVGNAEIGERGDMDWAEYQAKQDAWKAAHNMADCEHGFYAYFDGHSNGYANNPVVSGVIEAYGEVFIGTKGFRAAKARIIALSVQPYDGMWALDEFFVKRLRVNYPGIPVFESELAMRAEFPCPVYEPGDVGEFEEVVSQGFKGVA